VVYPRGNSENEEEEIKQVYLSGKTILHTQINGGSFCALMS